MGFGGHEKKLLAVNITDPGADKRVPLLRVPDGHTWTVEKAYIVPDTSVAGGAGTADFWQASLENGGTSGTAQDVMSDTVGGTVGWTLNQPKALTIVSGAGDLTAGQYLNLKYDEGGTIAPGRFTVFVEYVDGVGSKA